MHLIDWYYVSISKIVSLELQGMKVIHQTLRAGVATVLVTMNILWCGDSMNGSVMKVFIWEYRGTPVLLYLLSPTILAAPASLSSFPLRCPSLLMCSNIWHIEMWIHLAFHSPTKLSSQNISKLSLTIRFFSHCL